MILTIGTIRKRLMTLAHVFPPQSAIVCAHCAHLQWWNVDNVTPVSTTPSFPEAEIQLGARSSSSLCSPTFLTTDSVHLRYCLAATYCASGMDKTQLTPHS